MAKAVNRRSIVEKLNKHGYEVVRTNQLFELFSNEEGKAFPLKLFERILLCHVG